MLRAGTHRGERFEDAPYRDRAYCIWVLEASPAPQWFQRFASYARKTHGGILGIGGGGGCGWAGGAGEGGGVAGGELAS